MLNSVANKAACFGKALRPEFEIYNQAVVDNAHTFANTLSNAGFRIIAAGSDTSLVLVDLSSRRTTGDLAAKALLSQSCLSKSCSDFSATFTTIAFDDSSSRWLEINT
jgi:glycine/serine hydroxymethyltransferase